MLESRPEDALGSFVETVENVETVEAVETVETVETVKTDNLKARDTCASKKQPIQIK